MMLPVIITELSGLQTLRDSSDNTMDQALSALE